MRPCAEELLQCLVVDVGVIYFLIIGAKVEQQFFIAPQKGVVSILRVFHIRTTQPSRRTNARNSRGVLATSNQ